MIQKKSNDKENQSQLTPIVVMEKIQQIKAEREREQKK